MTETKKLLLHWWHHYEPMIYTLEELNKFESIIDKYGEEKILAAIIGTILLTNRFMSPVVFLMAIRNNQVEELMNSLPNLENDDKEIKQTYNTLKDIVLKTLEDCYLNKENKQPY